jgi:hypothetical protein
LGGYWLNDDWPILYTVTGHQFPPHEQFTIYNGHFIPGVFALFELVQRLAPGSYSTAVMLAATLQAVGTVLAYLVLRRLFGPRPFIFVALLWFALTTMTLSSSLWMTVAFYVLPFQIAFACSVLLVLRYLERPSRGGACAIAATCALGLLWYEKSALIPLVLFALVAWFPLVSSSPPGARRAFREHRRLWALLGAVLACYAVLYVALNTLGADTPSNEPGFGLEALVSLAQRVFASFASSVVGGPWRWTSGGPEVGADPPHVLFIVAVLLLGALVACTSLRRRTARRAWLFLVAYLVVDIGLLAYARLGFWGPDIGRQYRALADAAIPTTLAFSFALIPTRAEGGQARHRPLTIGAPRGLRGAALVGVVAVFLASVTASYGGALRAWSKNPAKTYAATARRGFPMVGADGLLVQYVPPQVLGGLFYPLNTTQVVLSSLAGHPPFPASVHRLFALDRRGKIQPAQVVGWESLPGAKPGCGWEISGRHGTVRLNGDVWAWSWYARLAYTSVGPLSGRIELGHASRQVRFEPGHHEMYLSLLGGGRNLEIHDLPPGAKLCVASATIGSLDVETATSHREPE